MNYCTQKLLYTENPLNRVYSSWRCVPTRIIHHEYHAAFISTLIGASHRHRRASDAHIYNRTSRSRAPTTHKHTHYPRLKAPIQKTYSIPETMKAFHPRKSRRRTPQWLIDEISRVCVHSTYIYTIYIKLSNTRKPRKPAGQSSHPDESDSRMCVSTLRECVRVSLIVAAVLGAVVLLEAVLCVKLRVRAIHSR